MGSVRSESCMIYSSEPLFFGLSLSVTIFIFSPQAQASNQRQSQFNLACPSRRLKVSFRFIGKQENDSVHTPKVKLILLSREKSLLTLSSPLNFFETRLVLSHLVPILRRRRRRLKSLEIEVALRFFSDAGLIHDSFHSLSGYAGFCLDG